VADEQNTGEVRFCRLAYDGRGGGAMGGPVGPAGEVLPYQRGTRLRAAVFGPQSWELMPFAEIDTVT
jgi:hypothetical protein